MLDGILGRGFTSKCKSLIKLTKSRIDVIRRKKKATLKFLKKDIADLLSNGLDINAYGRAEGLLVELTIFSCYDFVEQSCDTVLKHLPIMQKQRECPEECREAIASLMFAAARFSDLPELRDLRQIFQERFGTSLEHLKNQKFVENLASKPSTLENRVQLLQDIALEFSIKWDSAGFEKRMSTPPANAQGLPKAVEKSPSRAKEIDLRGVGKDDASNKESFEYANGRHRFVNPPDSTISGGKELKFQSRQELPGNGHEKRVREKEEANLTFDGHINHYGVKGSTVNKHEGRNGTVNSSPRTGRMGSSSSSEVLGNAEEGQFVHNGHEKRVYEKKESNLKFDGHINHYGVKGSTVNKHEGGNGTMSSSHRTGRMGSSSSSEVLGNAEEGPFVHNGRERTGPDYLNSSPYHNPGPAPITKHEARNVMRGSAFRTTGTIGSSSSEVLGDAGDGPVVHIGRERAGANYLKSSPYNNPGVALSGAGLHSKSDIKEPSSGNTHTAHNGRELPFKSDVKESIFGSTHTEQDKHHNLKPSYNSTLPPYVKVNSRRKDNKDRGQLELSRTGHDNNCISTDLQKHVKSEMVADVIQLEPRHSDHERQVASPMKTRNRDGEMDHVFGARIPPDALPKPKSVRRRHHKPRSSHSVDDNVEDIRTVRKNSRRRRDDKRGLQLLVDEEDNEKDEEERIMDNLLIHYSKKPATFEPEKMRRKPKIHLAPAKCPSNKISRDGANMQADAVPPPARSVSVPREHHLGPSEATKVYTRAASFQPDRSSEAKHVHPKLPDYDDLAARFAALRGG
ncbi:IST1-like protein [Cucurbita argyrosperma subsp. argyrosperma]|nr:IST1-like protein [Cucurbita argyrosperma subsp. argyrosperma]